MSVLLGEGLTEPGLHLVARARALGIWALAASALVSHEVSFVGDGGDGRESSVQPTKAGDGAPAGCARVRGSGLAVSTLPRRPLPHPRRIAGLVDVVHRDLQPLAQAEGVLAGRHRPAGPLAVVRDEHNRRGGDVGRGFDVALDEQPGLDELPEMRLDGVPVGAGGPGDAGGLPAAAPERHTADRMPWRSVTGCPHTHRAQRSVTRMPATADPTHDLVILGGGSGGYACALRAAELGLTVALVEKAKLGGTCLHQGCIPTKALLHAAEVADNAREGATFGVRSSVDSIDMAGVLSYKDGVVGRLYKGLQGLIASRAIDYVEGEGRLSAPHTVTVGDRALVGRHVVLATGSAAKSLPGLEIGGRIVTSEQALQLDTLPGSVIVLGGGVIGVEFASVYRSFGAQVTIVEALPRLVAAEDEAVSKALERAF